MFFPLSSHLLLLVVTLNFDRTRVLDLAKDSRMVAEAVSAEFSHLHHSINSSADPVVAKSSKSKYPLGIGVVDMCVMELVKFSKS